MYFSTIFIFSSLLVSFAQCSPWSYTNPATSPAKWADIGYPMCGGFSQSPINLTYDESQYDALLEPPVFNETSAFPIDSHFIMKNNGHSLQISLPSCNYIFQLNGNVSGEFCIEQFHFHWGNESSIGSEHIIDGKQFSLELHIVGYDKSYYSSFDEASIGVDGLAVLSALFEEDSEISIEETILNKMSGFLNKTSEIVNPNTQTTIAPFPISVFSDILESDSEFYRYEGSLTTPPCTENVYWTVLTNPLPVTPDQLAKFRQLKYPNTEMVKDMVNNFRPTRALNPPGTIVPRVVYRSWNPATCVSSSSLLLVLLPITTAFKLF